MPVAKGKPSTSAKPKKVAPKKPAPKGKVPAKAAPKAPARRSAPPPPPEPQPSFWGSLSVDRRLDIVGVVLALLGFVTLLSLLTQNRGVFIETWVRFLRLLFGWGAYVLPVALLIVGVWLVLRKLESIPTVSAERITGAALLFGWTLVVLHAFAGDPAGQIPEQAGGGALGGLIARPMWVWLGSGGAVVVLIAWLMIGLTMALDLSVPELMRWLAPLGKKAKAFWTRAGSRLRKPDTGPAPLLDNDFTPFQRGDLPQQPVSLPSAPVVQAGQHLSQPVIAWQLPPFKDILDPGNAPAVNEEFVEQRALLIEETLASFGAPSQVVEINRGPSITQFGVEPMFIETRNGRTRVRVSKIVSLTDDLALALAAPRIRIQAPVPGRSYVGIEVPNEEMTLVSLRDIFESEIYQRTKSSLRFALGRDVAGLPKLADLSNMPHLLIAGTTGSGKSVCVNSILTCLLLNNTPDDLRLILVDPKRVELTGYNGIPHLLSPVVVEIERVIGALQWMTREMDKRYHEFARMGARNIQDYNARMKAQGAKKLPYLVIVIDELADLMMLAPDETERTITRLAQLARATGIHMILATQRPSVDVVTGLIKANFPARIAFAVASNTDSRVILDQPGAERLLGRGDMLYQAPEAPAPVRLQGVFVSDHEIQKLVDAWRMQSGQANPYAAPGAPVDAVPAAGVPLKQVPMWEDMAPVEEGDPLMGEAVDLVRREGRASVSMLQRRLRIGYTRAARLVDKMEDDGIVGPPQGGTGVREVLDYGPTAPPKED
ncbi:MAG: DNA translocase FtsK 4TM domain-containing protein [Chloroflexota bacterium]